MSTPAQIDVGSLFSVKGMVAFVTGGGTGIGLMITKALVDAGAAKVYIAGRRQDVLQSAATTLNKPDVVVPLQCDVTCTSSLESAVSRIEKDAGFLNLVVCNAGVGGPQVAFPKPGESIEEWQAKNLAVDPGSYTKTFEINASSVWYTAMSCLKLLDAGNKKGNLGWTSQVVVTSSIAAFNKKAPGGWAYGQSKAAATHLAKQLSVVLPTWGIRANCICPGLFPSEMSAPIVQAAGGSVDVNGGLIPVDKGVVPLGRMGDAEDMAGQILYLASKAGSYCNGNIVLVEGGRLTTFPTTGY